MATVGCAGILVADTFCGPMPAMPAPGELLTVDDMPMSVGGCAANVAIDLARQGVEAEVAGRLGTDGPGEGILTALRRAKVGCGRVVRSARLPTSKTVVLLVAGQDRRYIHAFGANRAFAVKDIDPTWVATLRVFYLGGLFAMPAMVVDDLANLFDLCRRSGVATVVDVVAPRRSADAQALNRLLPLIDYFLPNTDEAREFTEACDPVDQIAALQAGGARTVIVTCGAQGSLAGANQRLWRAHPCRVETVDPSGAGDAFAAGVITGIVRGWSLPVSLRYASALGASATRAVGTTTGVFHRDEVESFLAVNPIEIEEVR